MKKKKLSASRLKLEAQIHGKNGYGLHSPVCEEEQCGSGLGLDGWKQEGGRQVEVTPRADPKGSGLPVSGRQSGQEDHGWEAGGV